MVMRYHWGLGVGHIYSHNDMTSPPTTIPRTDGQEPTTASQSQGGPYQEIAVTAANMSADTDTGATQSNDLRRAEDKEEGEESDGSVEEPGTDDDNSDWDDQEDSAEDVDPDWSDHSDGEIEDDFDPSESTSYD